MTVLTGIYQTVFDTSVGVSNFLLVILQRQRRTKNRVKRLRWSFFWKIEDVFLAAESSMVLPPYPRKIKYLTNILKMTLKKTSFFVIERQIYINLYHSAPSILIQQNTLQSPHPPSIALVELILINQRVMKKLFMYLQQLLCIRICLTLQRHNTLQLIQIFTIVKNYQH